MKKSTKKEEPVILHEEEVVLQEAEAQNMQIEAEVDGKFASLGDGGEDVPETEVEVIPEVVEEDAGDDEQGDSNSEDLENVVKSAVEEVLSEERELSILRRINPTIGSTSELGETYRALVATKLIDPTTAYYATVGRQTVQKNSGEEKAHMVASGGGVQFATGVDIPSGEIGEWQEMFPGVDKEELRAIYNRALSAGNY